LLIYTGLELRGGGHSTEQLVAALRYKPEDREFDSRWCHQNFLLTQSFRSHYGPEVDTASNRNEYHEYFLGSKDGRCVGLTTLLSSCADCLEIWEPQLTILACIGIALVILPCRGKGRLMTNLCRHGGEVYA